MRLSRLLGIAIAISLAGFAADDPFVGSWKLNLERSKAVTPGILLRPSTISIEVTPGGYVQTNDTGGSIELNLDGKDYPRSDGISKSVGADTSSVRRVNTHTIEGTFKRGGKPVGTITRVVSDDGRVLTRTTEGADAKGRKINVVEVFDKQ